MSNPVNARTIEFLLQPELLWCQIKFSSTSLSQQLFNPNRNINKNKFFSNSFSLLTPNIDSDENIMDIDDQMTPTKQTPPQKILASWTTNAGISELSEELFVHLNQKKQLDEESGNIESLLMDYIMPVTNIDSATKINQCMRFNLICHRGTSADIPILKLFKLFTSTLKKADPTLVILPFLATTQHYSSLSTLKQINSMDGNKMHQYFKTFHQCQLYSLRGYFHISTAFSYNELIQSTPISEWLDSYNYYIKLCPRQTEEIIQVGALCYSSVFLFRDDLKKAIMLHPIWKPEFTDPPPFFDLYIGDFNAAGKKSKNALCFGRKIKKRRSYCPL